MTPRRPDPTQSGGGDTSGKMADPGGPPDPSDFRLLPPIFVPLSDDQRRSAVDALAELFVPYVEQAREQPK
jgi:hypothetical protein